jgi:hypothetical protein
VLFYRYYDYKRNPCFDIVLVISLRFPLRVSYISKCTKHVKTAVEVSAQLQHPMFSIHPSAPPPSPLSTIIQSTGVYRVEYRVARGFSGSGSLQFEKAGGKPVYGSVSILSTGGWQTWVKDAHLVNLSAGPIDFGIKATCGG